MRTTLRSLGAALAGYAVIIIVTSVGFPLVLGHPLVRKDDPREVLLGTLVAVIAGIAGGGLAMLIGVLRPIVNTALVTIPIAVETALVLALRMPPDQIIFDAVGALVLIGSTLLPGIVREVWSRRYRAAPGAA